MWYFYFVAVALANIVNYTLFLIRTSNFEAEAEHCRIIVGNLRLKSSLKDVLKLSFIVFQSIIRVTRVLNAV